MEIESKNGSKIKLQKGSETNFGRESLPNSSNQTISRNHISLKLNENHSTVNFKVNGKNPVYVHDNRTNQIRVYKRSETGEIETGDSFCVCSNNPVWFYLKKIENESENDIEKDEDLKEGFRVDDEEDLGIDYDEIETGDLLEFDPVKEFNFVVMGHEFDSYPKKMIRDIKSWDWFLEEPKQESDEDEVSDTKRKKGLRRKRKKGGRKDDEDDDVWTGESEEDVEVIKKIKNEVKPKYSTRSKKQAKNKKGSGASTSKSANDDTKMYGNDDVDEDEDDDENDETLGGFIVDDEDVGEGNDLDDEEEEFDEDEDEGEDE